MADLVLTAQQPFQLLLPNVTINDAGEYVCDLTGFVGGAITATTLGATGAVTFGSTLDVAGATTIDDTLEVTGASTLDDVSCVDLTAAGVVDLTSAINVKIPSTSPLNHYSLQIYLSDIIGANAKVGYVVVPLNGAGTIERIDAVCDALTATGDLVLTSAINGVAVTNGVITIPAATAAGTAATPASPTAAKTVAAGNVIRVAASGTQDAAGTAMITLTIRRSVPA